MKINYLGLRTLPTLLCLIFNLNMQAQEKRTLRIEDYPLWKSSPKIIAAETSDDGNWYVYQTGNDSIVTISLKKINNGPAYRFTANANPDIGIKSGFSQDSKHYAFISNDTLHLVALNSGKVKSFKGLKGFEFVGEGRYLLAEGEHTQDKSMCLKDLTNHNTVTINQLGQFAIDPAKKNIAVIVTKDNQQQVKVISLKSGFPASLIVSSPENGFSELTWNKTGTAFAFVESKGIKNRDSICKIHVCTHFGSQPIVTSLNPGISKNLPKSYTAMGDQLYLSADGKQLFFYLTKNKAENPKTNLNNKSGIELWLPSDPILSPNARLRRDDRQLWYQWSLAGDQVMAVADSTFTNARLTGDDKNALIYHKRDYLPRHKYGDAFMDVYIKDLATGSTRLLLEKVWDQPNLVSLSPGGRYIAYYKAKNWWIYDIHQDKHRCLTKGFSTPIENTELNVSGTVPNYGSPGWLDNDTELMIYDKNDIWLLSADGKKKLKMTNGSETNQTFRIPRLSNLRQTYPGLGKDWFTPRVYNGTEGIVIRSVNDENLDNGLFLWTYKTG